MLGRTCSSECATRAEIDDAINVAIVHYLGWHQLAVLGVQRIDIDDKNGQFLSRLAPVPLARNMQFSSIFETVPASSCDELDTAGGMVVVVGDIRRKFGIGGLRFDPLLGTECANSVSEQSDVRAGRSMRFNCCQNQYRGRAEHCRHTHQIDASIKQDGALPGIPVSKSFPEACRTARRLSGDKESPGRSDVCLRACNPSWADRRQAPARPRLNEQRKIPRAAQAPQIRP